MTRPLEAPALFQPFPMMEQAQAQVWSYSPRFRRPRHFHAEPELNLIVHGSARFGVGHARIDVRAGDVLGFAAGQDHVMLDASPDLTLLALAAKPELVSRSSALRSASAPPLQLRPRGSDFAALVAHAERVAGCADESGAAELWEMAGALALRSEACRDRPTHVLTRRALALLAGDLELGRSALAQYSQGHPTELSRHFHRDVGVTLVRYRTRLRILALIRETDAGAGNLARAALVAGFGSYSQCHRAFALELGCSPSEFFSGGLRAEMEHRFEPAATAALVAIANVHQATRLMAALAGKSPERASDPRSRPARSQR